MKNNSGFTLIEFLIYLGLFLVIFSGLLGGIMAVAQSAGGDDARVMAQAEGEFLMAKIAGALPDDDFEVENGQLKFNDAALNNSQTSISNFEIVDLGDGMARASFVLAVRDRHGKNFSREFGQTFFKNK